MIGRQNLNRAVHDDIVVVELLPKDQWKIAAEDIIDEGIYINSFLILIIIDGDLEKKTVVDTENTMNEEESTIQPMDTDEVLTCSPVGKVVGIVRRNWRAYCGTIDAKSVSKSLAQQSVWFYPVDKRVPRIRIRTRQANQLLGHRVIVSIDAWDRKSMYPRGHFVKKLGSSGDKATEMEVLLLEHGNI